MEPLLMFVLMLILPPLFGGQIMIWWSTVLFVQFAVTASYLDPMVFWAEAPILPVLIFAAAIVLFVALAYYIGGKRLLQCE